MNPDTVGVTESFPNNSGDYHKISERKEVEEGEEIASEVECGSLTIVKEVSLEKAREKDGWKMCPRCFDNGEDSIQDLKEELLKSSEWSEDMFSGEYSIKKKGWKKLVEDYSTTNGEEKDE